jgi:hypothetical protein
MIVGKLGNRSPRARLDLPAQYSLLAYPEEGSVNFGWTAWVFLFLGCVLSFILPFYATWKVLPQNDHPLKTSNSDIGSADI